MKAGGLKLRAELELDRFALDPYCKLYLPLWKLDGDSFADHSAYGHLCTNYGSLWTPQGRSFDGVDDYINVPRNGIQGFTDFSIELWAKRTGASETYAALVGEQSSSDISKRGFILLSDYPDCGFWVCDGTTNDYITPFPVDYTWTHIVSVFKGGNYLKVYKNAVVAASKDTTLPNLNPSITVSDLWIGQYSAYNFNGLIGEVRIYSRALTPQEILDHYIIGKEMFG